MVSDVECIPVTGVPSLGLWNNVRGVDSLFDARALLVYLRAADIVQTVLESLSFVELASALVTSFWLTKLTLSTQQIS